MIPFHAIARVLCVLVLLPVSAVAQNEQLGMYVVGQNDVLTITIYNQPQMTGKYIVEADGAFTFPLIGRVPALGLSVREIEDDVRMRLAKGILKNPQVGVAVEQHRSQQVFVIGEVRSPGGLPLIGAMTLIEALARVGSVTEKAGPVLLVVRPRAGGPAPDLAKVIDDKDPNAEVFRVDLDRLKSGGLAENVALQAGDMIVVPRAETVFVSGHVRAPGEIVIRKGMTVRQVLTLAGDVTERGSTRRIRIIRKVNGAEKQLDVKLEDPVQPGDHIVVRERLL